MNLVERRDVTLATLAHFTPKPFAWDKAATCVHMVRRHVRSMGKAVPPMPRFRSPLSARAALQERGWSNLAEMMDTLLPRIAPAEAIVGDVVEFPSDSDVFGALFVAVGNGRVMGYYEAVEGFAVMQPLTAPLAAWRV